MPVRAASARGLGEGPVRIPSFSENDDTDEGTPYHGVTEFGGDDDANDDEDSFHETNNTLPHPSFTETSTSSPRQPQRRTSITSVSSDDDSWASAQRVASTISSLAAT